MKNFICTKVNKSSCNIKKDFSTIWVKLDYGKSLCCYTYSQKLYGQKA